MASTLQSLAHSENLLSLLSGTPSDANSSQLRQISSESPADSVDSPLDAVIRQLGDASLPRTAPPVTPPAPAPSSTPIRALDLSGFSDEPLSADEKLQMHLCALTQQNCFFCQREGHQMATCPIGRRMLDNPNARRILRALLRKFDDSGSSSGNSPDSAPPGGSVNATTTTPPASNPSADDGDDSASLVSAGSFDLLNHF
jgi:hypothetical protein